MSIKNIYLVEDHPLMQRLLYEFINGLPDLHVCGVATTVQQAVDQLPEAGADLVLADLALPDRSGIELVRLLQAQCPALPCLMVSSYQEANHVQQALTAGARGYLFKGDPLELAQAIRHVLAGEIYLSQPVGTDQPAPAG